MAFTSNDDLNILQASDSQNVGAGAGNDTYIVTPTTMSAGQEINITDTEGANNIKLVGGVTIVSSTVAANSIQLTINNGGIINIFGADTFSYILGGDAFDATSGVSQSFTDFVTNSLGLDAVPTGTNTANGTTTNESVNEDGTIGTPTPTFALAGAASVDEGATANFTLTTTNVADGTTINYTIAGVSAADVTGGLTGTATVTGNTATIAVPVVADTTTEGAETLTVSIDGQAGVSASTTVNDTSTTPTTPTFDLAANAANANEGTTATFTLTTTNVADGTSVAYTVSGVDAADVDSLTGTAIVTGNTATISVALTEDNTTEGAETLTVSIDGQTASAVVTVNDTSLDPVNQTFTLTTNPDGVTGGAADDLFVASNATLSAADVLDGGDGTDTLRYASSGAGAVNESGFAASNIENLNIIADATGGTTFDVTGASGVQKVTNDNSSGNLTLSGGNSLYDLELKNVTGGNTVVDNDASAVTGSSDTQNVVLDGVESIADTAVSSLTVDTGIETVAITTQNGSSQLTDLVAAGANTVTVAGDQNLSITDTLDGIATVDASTFTGELSVQADAGESLNVTGGTGDDTVTINATSLSSNDTLNGGAGTDTLSLSNTQAVAGTGSASISNFEQLGVTDAASGTIDMDNFANFSKVILDGGLGGNVLIDDAVTGITVEVDQNTAAGNTFEVDLKTDGNADEITLLFDDIDDADAIGAVTANDAETLNLNGSKLSSGSSQDLTIADLNATDATTINITSDAALDLTDADTTNVTVVNAAASTGNLDLEELDLASSGATVTLGSGADTITSGAGADTITGGDGKDVFKYTALGQSDSVGTDTIKDFVSGTDIINLQELVGATVVSSSQFKGVFNDFGSAQGALSGAIGTLVPGDTVFEANFDGNGNGRLWVDVNGDGTLSNADLRIILEGVSTITAADLGLALTGNTIDLTAAAAVVNATTNTNATATSTNENDTITASIADMSGSTINGLVGTDTLTLGDAGTIALDDAGTGGTLANLETLVLANGANTITFGGDAGGISNVTGGTGADTVTTDNMTAGGTISLGDGGDSLTYSADLAATTIDLGAGNDTFTSAAVGDLGLTTGSLDGGTGTDTLSLVNGNDIDAETITNFENLTLEGNASVTMSTAQYAALTAGTTTAAAAAETVTLTGAGITQTLASEIETVDLSATTSANTLTLETAATDHVITMSASGDSLDATNNTGNLNITGGAGTDSISMGANLNANDTINGAGAADTVVITGAAITSANITNVETFTVTATATATVDFNALNTGVTSTINASTSTAALTIDVGTTNAAQDNLTVVDGQGDDTIIVQETDTSRSDQTISLATGGNDTIQIIDADIDANADQRVIINSFDVSNDKLNLDLDGAQTNAAFQTISTTGTALSVGANSIIEITSATVIDPSAVADNGSIETIIANAIGTTASAISVNDSFAVILYDASNAYVYGVSMGAVAAAGEVDLASITELEAIATLNGVTSGALDVINFA